MDQLHNTVKRSLHELIIHPLQEIVNEFLPERVLFSSYYLFDVINETPICKLVYHEGGCAVMRCPSASYCGVFTGNVPDGEYLFDFSQFLPHVQQSLLVWSWKEHSAVVIYHGQTDVIEIE